MNLTIHTPETAPDASRPILESIAAAVGFVPNLAASTAESPILLQAFDGLRRAVAELPPPEREVAGLAVGVTVDNAYGVAFHSTVLTQLGLSADDLAAMRAGRPPADARLAAVHDLAGAVATGRGKVDDEVIAAARAAGLDTSDILGIVAECTFASLVGIVDNLAGRVELDPPLAPQAWEAPAVAG